MDLFLISLLLLVLCALDELFIIPFGAAAGLVVILVELTFYFAGLRDFGTKVYLGNRLISSMNVFGSIFYSTGFRLVALSTK